MRKYIVLYLIFGYTLIHTAQIINRENNSEVEKGFRYWTHYFAKKHCSYALRNQKPEIAAYLGEIYLGSNWQDEIKTEISLENPKSGVNGCAGFLVRAQRDRILEAEKRDDVIQLIQEANASKDN